MLVARAAQRRVLCFAGHYVRQHRCLRSGARASRHPHASLGQVTDSLRCFATGYQMLALSSHHSHFSRSATVEPRSKNSDMGAHLQALAPIASALRLKPHVPSSLRCSTATRAKAASLLSPSHAPHSPSASCILASYVLLLHSDACCELSQFSEQIPEAQSWWCCLCCRETRCARNSWLQINTGRQSFKPCWLRW